MNFIDSYIQSLDGFLKDVTKIVFKWVSKFLCGYINILYVGSYFIHIVQILVLPRRLFK